MKTNINLNLSKNMFPDSGIEITDCFRQKSMGHPTLRDASIVLNECVGQGVIWNLAREISARTGLDVKKINSAISEIVDEYSKLTKEAGYEKWKEFANYIDPE